MSRVPPHASGSPPPRERADDLEHLEELGDDAIIAQQQGAHAPQPRAQVTEEARSVVISDHPAPAQSPPSDPRMPANSGTRRRSERTEKTVVIRDRRQVEELRREMAQYKERVAPRASSNKGLVLWVIVGLAAFLTGGLVALFATQDPSETPAQAGPLPSAAPAPKAAPTNTSEPPSVSIDELPIEPK